MMIDMNEDNLTAKEMLTILLHHQTTQSDRLNASLTSARSQLEHHEKMANIMAKELYASELEVNELKDQLALTQIKGD